MSQFKTTKGRQHYVGQAKLRAWIRDHHPDFERLRRRIVSSNILQAGKSSFPGTVRLDSYRTRPHGCLAHGKRFMR